MRARLGRRAVLLGLAPLFGLACAARAAEPPVGPDAELLEYLGSSDDADAELQQYLAKPDDGETQEAKPAPKRGSGKT